MSEQKFLLGYELAHNEQRKALAQFVHRFTGEHTPAWARLPMPDGRAYAVQFKDDADWLRHTCFAVNNDGKLSKRVHFCESSPTWPNNPELRKASQC